MYFMDNEKELIGKEIAFTQMAQFAQAITIATKDKGILIVEQYTDEDEGDTSIQVYPKKKARAYLAKNEYLRNKLHEAGVITDDDVAEFDEEERQKFEREREARRLLKERQEKEAYERLKAKFEN